MTATTPRRRSALAIPRTRGLITGLCLIILGAWGGIIPFVGPYFGYAFINHQTWHFTYGRLWLSILPGAAAVLAGLILLRAGNRVTAAFAGWLGAVAAAWFVIGPEVSRLWNHGTIQTGKPLGGYVRQTFEWLGYHYALGAALMLLAAFAIGRVSVAAARDVLAAEGGRGRFGRRRTRAATAAETADEPATRDATVAERTVAERRTTDEPAAAPAERGRVATAERSDAVAEAPTERGTTVQE
jgi:hypothetical protein